MNVKQPILKLAFMLVALFVSTPSIFAAGWCGISQKINCGGWVVQMAVFNGGAMGSNDCVSYTGCVTSAQWDWSNTGAWSQLLLEKEGFCGVNYRISNTEDFNVTYDGSFSNASSFHRLAIVSWGKTANNCDWTTDNLYELYIHEQSFNEGTHVDAYDSWCIYKGTSPECSGSTYELYDCEYQILGRSIRCWRNNPRTSGTTDVDCLWEAWRDLGIAPDVYYYFTEVGAEVGPESAGTFSINNPDMVRTEDQTGTNPGGIVDGGIYNINVNGKYLTAIGNSSGSNVVTQSGNSGAAKEWIVRQVSGDVFTLENGLGNFLHVAGSNKGANVNVTTATGNSDQEWEFQIDNQGVKRRVQNQLGLYYLKGARKNNANTTVNTYKSGGGNMDWVFEYTGNTARKSLKNTAEISKELNVFANRQSNLLSIDGKTFKKAALYSLDGSLKWESRVGNNHYDVDISNLQNGLYVVRTWGIDGNSEIKKIVLR